MKKIILILGVLAVPFIHGSRHLSKLPDTSSTAAPAGCAFAGKETSKITPKETLICILPSASENDISLVFSNEEKKCFIFTADISDLGLKQLQKNIPKLRGKVIKLYMTPANMERQAELLDEITREAKVFGVTFVCETFNES
jgi:hypothetical protein